MTSREAFHAYIAAETGRTPETWRSKGIVPEGIDPDAYLMGSDQREWRAWQASRQQALEEALTAIEKLGDHEQDMGREKEAFGCDISCDAIRSLSHPTGGKE